MISFGAGWVGGELYIWTEPGAPARDWREYQRFKTRGSAFNGLRLSLVPGLGRVAIKLEW